MKQHGAILPPSKMLSEGMMMFHVHLPCVAGLSVHSSVRHLPRCGTETVVAFYWWMSKETWLEVLPGALYPRNSSSLLSGQMPASLGDLKAHPISQALNIMCCLLLFFLHICRFLSPSWLSTPPSLPLLHFSTILSLLSLRIQLLNL